jgi:replicative DNA helicase
MIVPPPPMNLDAERSVLPTIILDNNLLSAVCEILEPNDFFLDHHRRIFRRMIAISESQKAIGLVTLTEELTKPKTPAIRHAR